MSVFLIPEDDSDRIIAFDTMSVETHDSTAQATEHPVEEGANTTDHVRKENDSLSLVGFVSNTPIYEGILDGPGRRRQLAKGLDLFPIPSYRGSLQAQEIELPKPTSPGALGLIGDLFSGSPVAKFSALSFDTFDAVREVYETLLALMNESVLFRVLTSVREYEDLVITTLQLPRAAADGSGGSFGLTMRTLRVVESGLVVGAATPTEPRGAAGQSKGGQGTSTPKGAAAVDPTTSESVLFKGLSAVGIL